MQEHEKVTSILAPSCETLGWGRPSWTHRESGRRRKKRRGSFEVIMRRFCSIWSMHHYWPLWVRTGPCSYRWLSDQINLLLSGWKQRLGTRKNGVSGAQELAPVTAVSVHVYINDSLMAFCDLCSNTGNFHSASCTCFTKEMWSFIIDVLSLECL